MLISAPGTPMAEPGLDRSTAHAGTVALRSQRFGTRLNTWRVFSNILLVDPSITVSDLLKVNVGTVQHNHRQCAPVAIPAKDVLAQVLFSRVPESLPFFGSVDGSKADTYQLIVARQRADCVSIRDADDSCRDDCFRQLHLRPSS